MWTSDYFSAFLALIICLPSSTAIPSRSLPRTLAGAHQGRSTTNSTFDYVVVGGGNAGLVLAARLSENPSIRVAVIEAGGFYEDAIGNGSQLSIPAQAVLWDGKNISDTNPNVDWGFGTVPQAVGSHRVLGFMF